MGQAKTNFILDICYFMSLYIFAYVPLLRQKSFCLSLFLLFYGNSIMPFYNVACLYHFLVYNFLLIILKFYSQFYCQAQLHADFIL